MPLGTCPTFHLDMCVFLSIPLSIVYIGQTLFTDWCPPTVKIDMSADREIHDRFPDPVPVRK